MSHITAWAEQVLGKCKHYYIIFIVPKCFRLPCPTHLAMEVPYPFVFHSAKYAPKLCFFLPLSGLGRGFRDHEWPP